MRLLRTLCKRSSDGRRWQRQQEGQNESTPTHSQTHTSKYLYIHMCVCVCGDGNRKPAKLALSDCKDFSAELEGIAGIGEGTVAGARARAVLAVKGESPTCISCVRKGQQRQQQRSSQQAAGKQYLYLSVCVSAVLYLQWLSVSLRLCVLGVRVCIMNAKMCTPYYPALAPPQKHNDVAAADDDDDDDVVYL